MKIKRCLSIICIEMIFCFVISTHATQVVKTTSINGMKYILSANIITNSSVLQVKRYIDKTDKKILAQLNVHRGCSKVIDFAFCQADKMMWVILKRDTISSKGSSLILYPLIYKKNTETFIYQTKNERIINHFDLTQLIRQMVISKFKHDNTFSLEKNAKLSNVKMKCLENNIVEISCDIGKKYIFIGEIGVDMKSKNFFSRQLRIISKEK